MTKKIMLLWFFLAIIISLGVFTLKGFGKETASKTKTGGTKITLEKIDEILRNQQDIITRLKDIKQELDIIRVRASQR